MLATLCRIDARPLKAALSETAKQIPFALALALTRTAQAAQADLRAHLGDDFTIRTGWLAKGIGITPATKGKLRAEVGSKDAFMETQAEGGTKRAHGGKLLAIPSKARPSPSALTRPSTWPGRLRRAKKGAYIPDSRGPLMFARDRKTGRLGSLLWVLRKSVRVPRRWHFADRVEAAVAESFPRIAVGVLEKIAADAARRAASKAAKLAATP